MRIIYNIAVIFSAAMLMASMGCKSENTTTQADERVLVAVGDSVLTLESVLRSIPSGLAPEDSTRLFHQIVDTWIRDLVLTEVAEKNIPDLDRIERMAEAYRNDLIVTSYLNTMGERFNEKVDEKRIREYYEANKEDLLLDEPLIKGAYLKVAASDENADNLRQWMAQFTEKSVDKIEKSGLKQASQYTYFRDQWQEWSSVAQQIPYRFYDADAFVKSTHNFETTEGGSLYLLHISEYLPSGSEMPYDYARIKIADIIRNSDINNYKHNLITDIYRDQIKKGTLRVGMYDPVSGEIKK